MKWVLRALFLGINSYLLSFMLFSHLLRTEMFPKFNRWVTCFMLTGAACKVYNPNELTVVQPDPCIDNLWGGVGDEIVRQGVYTYWPYYGAKLKMEADATPSEMATAQKLSIVCVDKLGNDTATVDGGIEFTAGQYDELTGVITISLETFDKYEPVSVEQLNDPNFRTIFAELVAHEIGHSFSLSHSNPGDRNEVMFYQMNGVKVMGELDHVQWCSTWGCP